MDIHNIDNYKGYMEQVKPIVEKYGGIFNLRRSYGSSKLISGHQREWFF